MNINYREIQQIPGIYKIINKINNKMYIGSSNDCRQRAYSHISSLRKNKHRNQMLQNAWNKYGEENFEFIIIACVLNINDLTRVEQEYLDEYKPYDKNIGYNICPNAQNTTGIKQSPETLVKIKLAMTGEKNPFYGKTHSEETRKIISEKAQKRMSDPKNNPYYGKKHSDNIKEKMKESKRKSLFVCLNNKKVYRSSGDASRELNLPIQCISNCIYGKQYSVKGYIFINIKDDKSIDWEALEKKHIEEVNSRKTKTYQKLSIINAGENNGFYGKTHTRETKEKLRQKHSKLHFKCDQTGQIFHSIREAGREFGQIISRSSIKNALYQKRTINGYSFSFIENKDKAA